MKTKIRWLKKVFASTSLIWLATSANMAQSETDITTWTGQDIGQVTQAGAHSQLANGEVIVSGSGNDIWNDQDDFYFIYKQVTGDATIVTKVNSVEYTHPWAKGAVMFREDLSTGSRNIALDLSAHQHIALQWRPTANQRSYYWGRNIASDSAWLKLERKGNEFAGYYSLDGVEWTLTTKKTFDFPETLYVGLAASPHITTSNNQVSFSSIDLQQPFNNKAKVYLMAGQSNMEGYGSNGGLADTSGADLADQRDDVFAKNIISNTRNLNGLAPGYGARSNMYGVELKLGNVLGDVLNEPVYLFKGAKGGTTLDNTAHWRPLAHGGEPGNLYDQLITGFQSFLQNDLDANQIDYEVAGFVWFQGYNDTFGTENNYEGHLRNLISSVRNDLNLPDLPVIITQINDNRGAAGDIVMAAQAKVAEEDGNARWVFTGDQRPYYHYGSDSYVVIGKRIAKAALAQLNYAGGVDDEFTATPDTQLVVPIQSSVLNNDLNHPSAAVLDSAPNHGQIVFNADGSFTYTPNAGYIGQDQFTYKPIFNGVTSNTTTVQLWVRDAQDALAMHYDFEGLSPFSDNQSGILAKAHNNPVPLVADSAHGQVAQFTSQNLLHYMTYYPEPYFLDLDTQENFSFSFWVKPDQGITGEQIFISNKYFYNSGSGLAITTNSAGNGISVYVAALNHDANQTRSKKFSASTPNLMDGNWHLVTVSFDFISDQGWIYFDDELATQSDLNQMQGEINKYEAAIGDGSVGGNGNSQGYQGLMDDIRLYRKALNADEVNALYQAY